MPGASSMPARVKRTVRNPSSTLISFGPADSGASGSWDAAMQTLSRAVRAANRPRGGRPSSIPRSTLPDSGYRSTRSPTPPDWERPPHRSTWRCGFPARRAGYASDESAVPARLLNDARPPASPRTASRVTTNSDARFHRYDAPPSESFSQSASFRPPAPPVPDAHAIRGNPDWRDCERQ